MRPTEGGEARPVTDYRSSDFGLPTMGMFTKFAIGSGFAVLPLEHRSARILVLEGDVGH